MTTDEEFDEPGDLRREIEKLHAKLDRQAERDAKLTRERAVLAAFIRHGDGNLNDVRRIVDEALGDSSPWKLRFIGGREPNAVRSLDEAMRFKIKEGGK